MPLLKLWRVSFALLGMLLVAAPTVHAQDAPLEDQTTLDSRPEIPAGAPAWLREFPSVRSVLQKIRGTNAMDTAGRQYIALNQLLVMKNERLIAEGSSTISDDSRVVADTYSNAKTRILEQANKRFPPACITSSCQTARSEFYQGQTAVPQEALTQQLLDTFFSPTWAAEYRNELAEQQEKLASQQRSAEFQAMVMSAVVAAFWIAVVIGVVWLVLWMRRRGKAKRAAAVDAAQRPDFEAWEKLGETPEERTRAINAMFDSKSGTIGFGTRFYFIVNVTRQTEQGTRVSRENKFLNFRISRNLSAMDNREREFLRTTYLLYNGGVISEPQWRHLTFCLVYGDGKANIESWNVPSLSLDGDVKLPDGASVVEYFKVQHDATVDSAVSSLLTLMDKQGAVAGSGSNSVAADARKRMHGGSAWLSPEEVSESLFGGDAKFSLRLGLLDGSNQELSYGGDGSLITIAPPGSGKTQCFVLPNMLSWEGPAVVLDVKGEIFEATSKWRAKNVGPVYKFSPLDPANSQSYNPLTFLRDDPDYIWEDARFLADMLIVPSGGSDPFWENSARDVVTAAIAYLTQTNPPDQRPMSKLMDLMYGIGWDVMVALLRTNLLVGAMRQSGQALTDMDSKQRDSVLKTAQSSLSAWQGERISRVTRKSDWNPLDARAARATIYMCVNPNEIDSYLSLLRVFIAQHIRMLTSMLPPRDALPILFVLDELPRLRKMPPVDEALNIGRQYGIRLWMFAQSYGQLKESYPNAEGMLGSCAVRMFMNVPLNDELAQKLSDQLGYRESPLDSSRVKLVEPIDLAGPGYRDLTIVMATNTKPAKVRKVYAYSDPVMQARMVSVSPADASA